MEFLSIPVCLHSSSFQDEKVKLHWIDNIICSYFSIPLCPSAAFLRNINVQYIRNCYISHYTYWFLFSFFPSGGIHVKSLIRKLDVTGNSVFRCHAMGRFWVTVNFKTSLQILAISNSQQKRFLLLKNVSFEAAFIFGRCHLTWLNYV